MARMPTILSGAGALLRGRRGLVIPAAVTAMSLAILVPLPSSAVDVLFVASLAVSAAVLLATLLVASPIEFRVFPAILLLATLGRLVLGVAATRLVLACGQGGAAPEESQQAAGAVVWAVANFAAGASPAAGLAVLGLLIVIQLLVVAKGAGRLSEVAARFALDAMPGKQMAIDSDLAAGLIGDDEARLRRRQVAREADFHAAMDGASKFLWGDAVAAAIIAAVCLLGGMYVGMRDRGWQWSESADIFTRLAVGVGLATQAPAMLLAIASSVLITRSADREDLWDQFARPLIGRPAVLALTAGLIAALLLTPLPKWPLALVAGGLGVGALAIRRSAGRSNRSADSSRGEQGEIGADETSSPAGGSLPPAAAASGNRAGGRKGGAPRADADSPQPPAVDPLRLDLGYALIGWADASGQDELLERLAALRKRLAQDLGLMAPPIRIRDEMSLEAHSYAIYVRSARVAQGRLYSNLLLAVGDGEAAPGALLGRPTQDPVYGTPAIWIHPDQRDQAESLHYVVISPLSVLLTHLDQTIRANAADLLTREQTARLLEHLKRSAPVLAEEVAGRLSVGHVQKTLQELLRQHVPIRDLEAILEAATEGPAAAADPLSLAERARAKLARGLGQRHCAEDGRLWCVSLPSETEEELGRYVAEGEPLAAAVPPEAQQSLAEYVGERLAGLERQGRPPVVVCSAGVRSAVQRLLAPSLPRAVVLAYSELESVRLEPFPVTRNEP
jgi:flagellar biosynthesis protein FlhA